MDMTPKALQQKIHELEGQMMQHAQNLEFEEAAQIRDQLHQLLVAYLRRLLKLEVLRVLHHLPFQLVDFLLQRFWRHIHSAKPGRLNGLRFTAPFGFGFRQALAQLQGAQRQRQGHPLRR